MAGTVAGTCAVSRIRGLRAGGDAPSVGAGRPPGVRVPLGVVAEAASAADPKDGGITRTPGNAGVRSAAMFMAYANGDWKYTSDVQMSVCGQRTLVSC